MPRGWRTRRSASSSPPISPDINNPALTISNTYTPTVWNDTEASQNLVDGPNYSITPPKLEGTVWTDISPTTDDTPWQLTNNLQPKV